MYYTHYISLYIFLVCSGRRLSRRRENMVGVNMVLAEHVLWFYGVYGSWFLWFMCSFLFLRKEMVLRFSWFIQFLRFYARTMFTPTMFSRRPLPPPPGRATAHDCALVQWISNDIIL